MIRNIMLAENALLKLLDKVYYLRSVIQKLNRERIRYAVYSGSFVAIATDYRQTNDIDIVVHDDDILTVKRMFPFAKTKDIGSGVFMYIGPDDDIELVSQSDIYINGHYYKFRLTNLAWKNSMRLVIDDLEISCMNPVDTILMKAFLQRGKDVGKYDFEDIERLLAAVDIDRKYLKGRLKEINVNQRVIKVLNKYDLMLKHY